jgi:hypothetical protein
VKKRLEIAVEREKRDCEKFWGKRGCGNKRFSVKKEAVGNSWEKRRREQVVPSEKKRLWEILGKERFREQGVPCEKRGCGKFWGKRGCGNKGFPLKK